MAGSSADGRLAGRPGPSGLPGRTGAAGSDRPGAGAAGSVGAGSPPAGSVWLPSGACSTVPTSCVRTGPAGISIESSVRSTRASGSFGAEAVWFSKDSSPARSESVTAGETGPGLLVLMPGACADGLMPCADDPASDARGRSEEHTSELQSRGHLVCRLLL